MYESFYKLRKQPFRLTPDPYFFFRSKTHGRGLAYLHYALEQGEGFVLITGAPGTGKTEIALNLISEVPRSRITFANIVTTILDEVDILHLIAASFNISSDGLNKGTLIKKLENFFISEAQKKHRCVLLIDEAHNLSNAALIELSMLANFQFCNKPVLQYFILGYESLEDKLEEAELLQLKQRIIASSRLEPLSEIETREYIEHRLSKVGWTGVPNFSDATHALLYLFSGGVPRQINAVCNRLLLKGFIEEKYDFDKIFITELIEELEHEKTFSHASYSKDQIEVVISQYDLHKTDQSVEIASKVIGGNDLHQPLLIDDGADALVREEKNTALIMNFPSNRKVNYVDDEIELNLLETPVVDSEITYHQETNILEVERKKRKKKNWKKFRATFLIIPILFIPLIIFFINIFESDEIIPTSTSVRDISVFSNIEKMDKELFRVEVEPVVMLPEKIDIQSEKNVELEKKLIVKPINDMKELEFIALNEAAKQSATIEKVKITNKNKEILGANKIDLNKGIVGEVPEVSSSVKKNISTKKIFVKEKIVENKSRNKNVEFKAIPILELAQVSPVSINQEAIKFDIPKALLNNSERSVIKENEVMEKNIFEEKKQKINKKIIKRKVRVTSIFSSEELKKLLSNLTFAYESGNLNAFIANFSENVRNDDGDNLSDIKDDYRKLFNITDYRKMGLHNVKWKDENKKMIGKGEFKVLVREKGAREISSITGDINLTVEKHNGRTAITELSYLYYD